MKKMKRIVLRIFFVTELVVFSFFYIFGAQGMRSLACIKAENEQLALEVDALRAEAKKLELQIALWQTNDFYKEKKAREQLQMAHTDDIVYYLNN
ncbi:MAG: septum formation initiator family protein [Candidatus Babeliales bacterium]